MLDPRKLEVTGNPDSLLGKTVVLKDKRIVKVLEVIRVMRLEELRVREEWLLRISTKLNNPFRDVTFTTNIPLDYVVGIMPDERPARADDHLRKALQDGYTIEASTGARWKLIDGKPMFFTQGRWESHSVFSTLDRFFESEKHIHGWKIIENNIEEAKQREIKKVVKYAWVANDGRIVHFTSIAKGEKYSKRRLDDHKESFRWGNAERSRRSHNMLITRAGQYDEVVGGCACQK